MINLGLGVAWTFGKINRFVSNMILAFRARVSADNGIFEAPACLEAQLERLRKDNLLSSASILITPNAYKEGKIYAIKPTNGAGDLSVVRATTATDVNSAGLIETVAANVPRLDYTNSTCPSILVEPQRTNVVLNSGNLNASTWNKPNYVLSSTSEIQGLPTTRITKNATSNGFYGSTGGRNVTSTIGTFASGVKTLSFLIRKGNTNKVGLLMNNVLVGAFTAVGCEFNFNTKTFTNIPSGLTASFENPTTDVYKIILTINDIGSGSSKAIWIAPIDDSNNTVDGGYLDFAYAQWELGSNATSYIPTVASTVTRNADVISKTGISSLINSVEGSFYVEASSFINGGSFRLISISDGTANNRITIAWSSITNTLLAFMNLSGTIRVNNNITPFTQTSNNKILFRWGSGNFNVFVNGVNRLSLTSVTMPTANLFNKLSFDLGTPSSFFEGNVKSVLVFPNALTDTECIQLTTL